MEEEILKKRGSWYSYQGETVDQGRANTKEWLQENPDIRSTIKRKIQEAIGIVEKSGSPGEDEMSEEGESDEGNGSE